MESRQERHPRTEQIFSPYTSVARVRTAGPTRERPHGSQLSNSTAPAPPPCYEGVCQTTPLQRRCSGQTLSESSDSMPRPLGQNERVSSLGPCTALGTGA